MDDSTAGAEESSQNTESSKVAQLIISVEASVWLEALYSIDSHLDGLASQTLIGLF